MEEKYVELNKEVYDNRKARFDNRINSMIEYVSSDQQCRSKMLLSYFGQKNAGNCGHCDVCLAKGYKKALSDESLLEQIRELVSNQNLTIEALLTKMPLENERAPELIKWAIDNDKIIVEDDDKLSWGAE